MNFIELALSIMPELLKGALVTLELVCICITIGFFLGILLAITRIYGNRFISNTTSAYVALMRGTPLLVQLFILYYGLPHIGLSLPSFLAAIIGISLNSAAYQSEYFRGAIQAVKSGQMIAARSIGMSKFKAVRYIILPQMIRIVIPSWSNELIYMIKYSSIAYMIQTPELMAAGKFIASTNFRTFEVFLVVAFIYLVIVIFASKSLSTVELKLKVPGL
ncbi:amino acid ABC transporter permease [Thermodesulfobacteriota bacterium]